MPNVAEETYEDHEFETEYVPINIEKLNVIQRYMYD